MKVTGEIVGISSADNMLHINGTSAIEYTPPGEGAKPSTTQGRFRINAPVTDENMRAFRVGQKVTIEILPAAKD